MESAYRKCALFIRLKGPLQQPLLLNILIANRVRGGRADMIGGQGGRGETGPDQHLTYFGSETRAGVAACNSAAMFTFPDEVLIFLSHAA